MPRQPDKNGPGQTGVRAARRIRGQHMNAPESLTGPGAFPHPPPDGETERENEREKKMGWTGIPMDRKPDCRELNEMVTERMERGEYRIIDRSGWLDHGRRIFLLIERERVREEGETPRAERFAAIVRTEYRGGELMIREDDESVGPNETDCPMRIMRQLEGHPPVNEFSKRWRERVLARHADMGPKKAALRKLRKEYPGGEGTLVLNTGEQVRYAQGKYRGQRNASAYTDPKDGMLRILRPQMIDPEATAALGQTDSGMEDTEQERTQTARGTA